jgi:hypothetical protein
MGGVEGIDLACLMHGPLVVQICHSYNPHVHCDGNVMCFSLQHHTRSSEHLSVLQTLASGADAAGTDAGLVASAFYFFGSYHCASLPQ